MSQDINVLISQKDENGNLKYFYPYTYAENVLMSEDGTPITDILETLNDPIKSSNTMTIEGTIAGKLIVDKFSGATTVSGNIVKPAEVNSITTKNEDETDDNTVIISKPIALFAVPSGAKDILTKLGSTATLTRYTRVSVFNGTNYDVTMINDIDEDYYTFEIENFLFGKENTGNRFTDMYSSHFTVSDSGAVETCTGTSYSDSLIIRTRQFTSETEFINYFKNDNLVVVYKPTTASTSQIEAANIADLDEITTFNDSTIIEFGCNRFDDLNDPSYWETGTIENGSDIDDAFDIEANEDEEFYSAVLRTFGVYYVAPVTTYRFSVSEDFELKVVEYSTTGRLIKDNGWATGDTVITINPNTSYIRFTVHDTTNDPIDIDVMGNTCNITVTSLTLAPDFDYKYPTSVIASKVFNIEAELNVHSSNINDIYSKISNIETSMNAIDIDEEEKKNSYDRNIIALWKAITQIRETIQSYHQDAVFTDDIDDPNDPLYTAGTNSTADASAGEGEDSGDGPSLDDLGGDDVIDGDEN